MTTKYIEIDRAIETALLLLEEGEDEQTLAYNAALVAFIKNMENVPAAKVINNLPSAETDIIQCRNCKFASGDSRICMQFGHSPIGELDFCAWAERRTDG